MDPQLVELLAGLQGLGLELKGVGWGWAGAVGALVGVIRIWRSTAAQAQIAEILVKRWPQLRWLLWDEMPVWARFVVPFVGAMGAGAITAAAGGMSWAAAVVGAVGVGVSSILTHHGTKAAGAALTPVTDKLHPSISRPVSLVFPIDPSRIPE